jgi:endonuclease/exonuclease/phosphatase family metal-dependent hydrolase
VGLSPWGVAVGTSFSDFDSQKQQTQPVELDGGRALPEALPAEALAELASIKRRKALVASEVYQRHAEQLMALTFALEHRPAPAAPREPGRGGGHSVRAVAWNIQRGKRLDLLIRYLREQPVLRRADVLLLAEVDVGMARSRNRHVAAELAEALGFHFVFGNSYVCLDHGDPRDGPKSGENRESLHGNAILSRYPIRRAENVSVAITKDKFHSSEKRLGHKKALWAELETPSGLLPVAVAHLDAYAASAQRAAQLDDLLAKLDAAHGADSRALLGGDLNTNTYDAGNVGQLLKNVWRKLWRGGFPHAIHHYVHPYELYERAVFAPFDARGYDYHGYNAPEVGTTRYEVGTFESESTVSEQLPAIAVKILRWKLRPWGGVAPIKVDWFAGRGLEVLHGQDERGPLSPTTVVKPGVDDVRLSDHDPIVVDVSW